MGDASPFGHLKQKLWSKERLGVKLSIWFPTIKSQESIRFPSVQATCDILLERFWQGIQLYFRPHCSRRSAHEVMRPQIYENPNCGNFGTPTWESWDKKNHLDVAPVERCKIYYKEEGGGFPQVRAVVSLVNPRLPVVCLTPEMFQPCTNNLLLVLCRFVWVIEAY
jgi:hypothetical protein